MKNHISPDLRFCRMFATLMAGALIGNGASAADPWIDFNGLEGPGKGKHIVLISGDEEYRSEETLPQLAKILANHHGFKCTVLFAIDPKDGTINPNQTDNIPGLGALDTADLMVIFTRFRELPDEQMKHIVDYVVGRCHHILESADPPQVVSIGAECLNFGHGLVL